MTAPPQQTVYKGIVKQVISGETIVIRGPAVKGPPKEKTVTLTGIKAPKLAKRAISGSEETKDEPWAWEAREFMRKKLIGEMVSCIPVENKSAGATAERFYGIVFLGKDQTGENINEAIVAEGLASLRGGGSDLAKLQELEAQAKAAGKGIWSPEDRNLHIRDIKWSIENMRNFMDKCSDKPVKAIIEHVRDGSTVRCFLLPDFYHITLMLSGIRCNGFKLDASGRPDPTIKVDFAEEARFFVETRLLQRDVEVLLETVNNNNFVGTILHPKGSIAELLLKEGFARCVDWSIAFMKSGADKLRAAEKEAKEKRLRLWKDYQPTTPVIKSKDYCGHNKKDFWYAELGDNYREMDPKVNRNTVVKKFNCLRTNYRKECAKVSKSVKHDVYTNEMYEPKLYQPKLCVPLLQFLKDQGTARKGRSTIDKEEKGNVRQIDDETTKESSDFIYESDNSKETFNAVERPSSSGTPTPIDATIDDETSKESSDFIYESDNSTETFNAVERPSSSGAPTLIDATIDDETSEESSDFIYESDDSTETFNAVERPWSSGTPTPIDATVSPPTTKRTLNLIEQASTNTLQLVGEKIATIKNDDSFDIFGKYIADRLRRITPDQHKFAQKLIGDVIFEAEMESLNRDSKIIVTQEMGYQQYANYQQFGQQPCPLQASNFYSVPREQ